MGITIFAQGKINHLEELPSLIEEVKGIAAKYGWKYAIIDDDFEDPPFIDLERNSESSDLNIVGSLGLKGIVITVDEGVEALHILFDRYGVLTGMMPQLLWLQNDKQGERFSACKTQFGSIDSHIRIVELYDILKKKYITNLEVEDEGSYWVSRNRNLLAEKRTVLEHYLEHTQTVIGGLDISCDTAQDPETVASCLEKALLDAETKNKSTH